MNHKIPYLVLLTLLFSFILSFGSASPGPDPNVPTSYLTQSHNDSTIESQSKTINPPANPTASSLPYTGAGSSEISKRVVFSNNFSDIFNENYLTNFQASLTIVEPNGLLSNVEIIKPETTLKEALNGNGLIVPNYMDSTGRALSPQKTFLNAESYMVFRVKSNVKYATTETPQPIVEELNSNLPEGVVLTVDEGQPGSMLQTSVSKVNQIKKTKKTVVYTTIVKSPISKKIIKGSGTVEKINTTKKSSDNKADNPSGLIPVGFAPPVSGAITSPYGMRVHPITGIYKLHDGDDFDSSCGDPVSAVASGTVIFAGWKTGYGNQVEIDHGNGFKTSYSHLSQTDRKVGDLIRAREIAGLTGSTGYSTGCHVHFMTILNDIPLNPVEFLNGIKN